ncbi:putrescine hydroxycinnamoyltransferase 1-like, partial [Asparagus officinalis]
PPTVTVDHFEYKPNHDPNESPPGPSVSEILPLTKHQISTLKQPKHPQNGHKVKELSTFRAVSAHIWRSACIARNLAPDQDTRFYTVANVRSKLNPPLPEGYFGNAIVRTSEGTKAGEIMSKPLEFAGEKVGRALAKVNDEYIRSLIDYFELGNDGKGWSLRESDLYAVSWLGMPIYDADFGWGKPEFMGRANTLCGRGVAYLLSSKENDGGISVVMEMEVENMEGFKKAFYEGLK